MNSRGKAKAIQVWAGGCPSIKRLKLNSVRMVNGELSIVTDVDERCIVQYIDGSEQRRMTFTLAAVMPWSDGRDDMNATALDAVNDFIDWASVQFPANVPDFGQDCIITAVEPLQNQAGIAEVSEKDSAARYTAKVAVEYIERKA